ncbi:MAG: superoxide dismutase [Micrococcales bacterium]|nr:superoxide dismutase [Micrococcales bacterium]
MADYTLPDLPYDYAALEPHISGRIMALHHDKHHATYVAGANTALEKLAAARAADDFGAVNMLEKNLAFNLGGHINHTMFWQNLSPDGGGRPEGELAAAVDEHFGSFDAFAGQFTANALGIQGSGWSVLAWDVVGARLVVLQQYDHQTNIPFGAVPIVILDMWEHSFYLDYVNVKPDYVKAWWNIVSWSDAADRFAKAQAIA